MHILRRMSALSCVLTFASSHHSWSHWVQTSPETGKNPSQSQRRRPRRTCRRKETKKKKRTRKKKKERRTGQRRYMSLGSRGAPEVQPQVELRIRHLLVS